MAFRFSRLPQPHSHNDGLHRKKNSTEYVIASGISDPTQMRVLLLHFAGPKVRDIFLPCRRKSQRLQES